MLEQWRQWSLTLLLGPLHLGEESMCALIILQFQQQLWGFLPSDTYPNTGLSGIQNTQRHTHIQAGCPDV